MLYSISQKYCTFEVQPSTTSKQLLRTRRSTTVAIAVVVATVVLYHLLRSKYCTVGSTVVGKSCTHSTSVTASITSSITTVEIQLGAKKLGHHVF